MWFKYCSEDCEQGSRGGGEQVFLVKASGGWGCTSPEDVYKSQHKSSLECIIGNNISRAGTAEVMDCECGQGCWQPRKAVEKKRRLPNQACWHRWSNRLGIVCQMPHLVQSTMMWHLGFNMWNQFANDALFACSSSSMDPLLMLHGSFYCHWCFHEEHFTVKPFHWTKGSFNY